MDKKTILLYSSPLSHSTSSLSAFSSKSSFTKGINDSRQSNRPSSVQIVLRTPHNVAERCELPIPVLVEEAFSFAERNVAITARVSECGYAWVVCGRRLFIWQFLPSPSQSQSQLKFPICHELKLPQSDLAHRAELVSVIPNKPGTNPSCVAVSPEGMVRYWPDITHNNGSMDENVELNGEECDSLIDAGHLGSIFVTTTCTVVLIQYKQGSYRNELHCRTLKTPGSWIGGFSRRVSSIFFGPMTSDHGSDSRIIRLLAVPGIQRSYSIYVLAGLNLQKWSLVEQNPEQLAWSSDLSRPVKDAFRAQIAHWDVCDPADIDMWILDMQPDKDGVLMLCAALNTHMSPQVYYGMVLFPVSSTAPKQPKDFLLLKIMGLYRDNNIAEVLNYKFILSGTTAYIYSTKSITVVNPTEDPDRLEFLHPSDHIFGGCTCRNVPIFFSRQHGLIVINAQDGETSFNLGGSISYMDTTTIPDLTVNQNNLSLYQLDPHAIHVAHRDTNGQLKAAFIFHVKNQLSESYDMVNKLFPADAPVLPSFDAPLDVVVVKIAKDILDDIPAGDSRWTQTDFPGQGLGSSHSMLLIQQLLDKQQAFNLYLKFLKESGLWDKLTGLTVRHNNMATIHFLAELGEKIVAAVSLKNSPTNMVLEETIERTVKNYRTKTGGGLSSHDVFYQEVSRVHEGFLWLAKVCEESSHSVSEPSDVSNTIHEGNQVLLNVLNHILQYRKQSCDVFCLNEISRSMDLEYLPWTAAGGHEGIMDALMLQHSLTLNYGLKVVGEGDIRETLLDEFILLTDIILDARKSHLATVKSGHEKVLYKQYSSDRHKLIKPLIEVKAHEQALMLAEKYMDFEILLNICEDTHDEERLNEYMRRFKDTGFSEFVYNWYMREGKQSKLLIRYSKSDECVPEGRDRLGRFLTAYPALSWIQATLDKNFGRTALILRQLGENETQSITRQKSMFSISKLAKLAALERADPREHIEAVNRRLDLISYQEQIPDYVIQQHGFDAANPKVLHPREIVALYISREYVDAKELEFRKALDVVNFIEEEAEKVELILEVWRAALLKDTWQFINIDEPLDCLQHTIFFKLVELSVNLGYDPNSILPPIDMLLDDSSLNNLLQIPNFRPLLKMGYEQFHRTQLP